MADKKKFTFKFTVEAYSMEDAYNELDEDIRKVMEEENSIARLVVQVDNEDECACGNEDCDGLCGRRNDS